MLINKDNPSIQQKYSFIEEVKLNKSGNVSESPPTGYGDCATRLLHYCEQDQSCGLNSILPPERRSVLKPVLPLLFTMKPPKELYRAFFCRKKVV